MNSVVNAFSELSEIFQNNFFKFLKIFQLFQVLFYSVKTVAQFITTKRAFLVLVSLIYNTDTGLF